MKIPLALIVTNFLGLGLAASPAASSYWRPGATAEVATVRSVLAAGTNVPARVTLEGTAVAQPDSWILYVRDATGAIPVFNLTRQPVVHGDRVRIAGRMGDRRHSLPILAADKVTVLAHGLPEETVTTEPAAILRGEHDYRLIATQGVLTDVFRDESDPDWAWALFEQSGVKIPVSIHLGPADFAYLLSQIDATVAITAIAVPDIERRTFMSYTLTTRHVSSLKILKAPPDPFAAEPFTYAPLEQIEHVRRFAHRRRATGHVIAAWGGNCLFIRLANGRPLRVRLAPGETLPDAGVCVTVAGFLRRDGFYPRFENARLRVEGDAPAAPPEEVVSFDSRRARFGAARPEIDSRLNGALVRVTGTVRNQILPGTDQAQFELDCGRLVIPVEAGRLPLPEVGAVVRVTGACIMHVEIEDPATRFARLTGFALAPRTADDVVCVRGPPWWTPGKFLAVIGVLALGLGVFLAWCVALARVSERKSRELLAEKSSRLAAQLRTEERTHLAVELHDTFAQSLTGVALQLDAAALAHEHRDATAQRHIDNARKALQACRQSLRHCLSDLRSRSFEQVDMNEAIAETVRPHIGPARLTVRFNAPRAAFSDSSAHAMLCIVRELAVNAVRHGRAAHIRVAGERDGDRVRFSVADDGRGFDIAHCPGSAEGHFGLLGIRERVQHFNGTFTLSSVPGRGTKATVTLRVS